jgi:hypothetical protein
MYTVHRILTYMADIEHTGSESERKGNGRFLMGCDRQRIAFTSRDCTPARSG